MNNEEVLRSLVEEIGRLREIIEVQNRSIEELREYIRSNANTNNVASVATDEQITSAVNNVVNNNINQPRSIVSSNAFRIDDNFMYGDDKANYYGDLNRKIVNEALEQRKKNAQAEVEKSQDNVEYIPGTNIPKPREMSYLETEKEYVEYLKEYYEKHFPNYKKYLAVIPDAPKTLATTDSVKKPEIPIETVENDEYEEIKPSSVEDSSDFNAIKEIFEVNPISSKSKNENIDSNTNEESMDNSGGAQDLEEQEKELREAIMNDLNAARNYNSDTYAASSNEGSRDIFSNSDGTSASINANEELEENTEEDDKSAVMENLTEEDRKKLEGLQSTDYKKDDNTETKKIGKIRKALGKFKNLLKKHKKKVIAGVLVAASTLGIALTVKACAYDNKDDLIENKDNPKSNTVNYDDTVPSVAVADSFESKTNEAFEKQGGSSETESKTESEVNAGKIVENINQKKNENFDISGSSYDVGLQVGDPVKLTGDYLYTNSYDAEYNTDGLTPYYSKDDNRAVSLVQYKGPNGEYATAYNKEDQKAFEDAGWTPIAYNVKNLDREGLTYEGWINPNDIIKLTVKNR